MRILLLFIFLITILEGALVPTPFFMSMQRVGRDSSLEYFDVNLFHDVYGIAMVKPRGTDSTLLVASDPDWNRLVYTHLDESGQDGKYLRAFGSYGTAYGKFIVPKGLCIDTTVYMDSVNQHAIYVADSWNNRVSKFIYSITNDTILSDGIVVSGLSNPTDVASTSRAGGGAYIVIVENAVHRIRIYERNADGSISWIQNYGTQGSSYGQFFHPSGVAICLATDGGGGYFIYVTDTGNRRVVCLRYKLSEGITWEGSYKTLENAHFLSVTASQYYCVYVSDFLQNKIWVFTPGLGELLYTYGNSSSLNGPKDVYIDWDRIGLTERWTASTGIQYFRIIPEIREFYPEPDTFDATEDSVRINFRVDETAHSLTMTVAGRTLFEDQYFTPGYYSVWWDGRDTLGLVVLPNMYEIQIYCQGDVIATTDVTVKGTQVSGILGQDEHWTEEGEPYVLTSDVQLYNNKNLTIDPGVKVMPTGNFVLKPHLSYCNSSIIARGSAINKILFTPHRKLLPEPEPVPKGFWKGIYYRGNTAEEDSLILDHCIIEYAGSDTAALHILQNTSPAIITNTEISHSAGFGFYEYYYSNVTIDNCVFEDNDSMPILTGFKAIGNISNNTFMNNQPDAIGLLSVPLQEDATAHNQDVPFWLLYAGFGRSFPIWGFNSLATLTIEPGTVIQCDDEVYLWVGQPSTTNRGCIVAQGDAVNPIIFTAIDTTKPWLGIHLNSYNPQDTSIFEYCELSHGWKPNTYSLYADGMLGLYCAHTPFILKNSTLRRSRGCGINYDGTTGDLSIIPEIKDNQFISNDSFPIIMPANYLRNMEGNTFIDNGYNELWVNPERINQSLTWQNQGVPYIVAGQIPIWGSGDTVVTVEIESGTILKFKQGSCALNIHQDDRLIAHQVVFTAADTLPCNQILIFDGADSSLVDSCLIENQWSPYEDYGAIDVTGSIVKVTNSMLSNNRTGLTIRSNSNVEMRNNQIVLNEHGVWVHDIPEAVLITHNDFFGNKCALTSAHSGGYPYTVADSNWWGHASGPWDPSEGPPDYNPLGQGDSIGDYVLYRPWLESPVHPEVITLIQPNGGETLYSGDEYEIQWSCSVTPVRQELYYTTDYPEAGLRSESLWIFIDTVAVGQTSYLWQVPGVASERCRVAVMIYYTESKTQIPKTKIQTNINFQNTNNEILEKEIATATASPRNDMQEGLSNEHKVRNTNMMIAIDISDANFSIILNEYTLSIFINGAGSVIKDPDLPLYPHGTSVVLTANPDPEDPLDPEPEWIFDSWSGDLGSSENPDTLVMDSDKSVIATFPYVLNLDSFPMYQAESLPGYHEMCGPAVGQMTLNYMWWNRITYPDSAPMLFDNQAVLYDTGIAHNATPGLDFFDLNGMWYVVQHYKPNPYTQYGYNFTKRQNADSTVLLKQICQWIDYRVGELSGGHEPGHPMHVPGIIPAYGNYTNWMAVRGFRADTVAYQMPDTLEIYGFWMNDPYPEILGGIGENSYKTVVQFLDEYYDPLSTGDQWDGKYVAICEPPEQGDECALIIAQPTPQFTDEQTHQLKLVSNQYDLPIGIKGWIIQAAINGVYDQLIPYDEHFKAVFQITTPGDPFLVKGIDNNDYYAVPFNFNFPVIGDFGQKKKSVVEEPPTTKTLEQPGLSEAVKDLNEASLPAVEPTLIVILIDAQDGHFKEASWTQSPVKYLPITKQEARNMLSEVLEELGIEAPTLNKLYPELIAVLS